MSLLHCVPCSCLHSNASCTFSSVLLSIIFCNICLVFLFIWFPAFIINGYSSLIIISVQLMVTLIGLWSESFSFHGNHWIFIIFSWILFIIIMSMLVFCWFLAPFLVHSSFLYIFHSRLIISSSTFFHVFVSVPGHVSVLISKFSKLCVGLLFQFSKMCVCGSC